MAMAIAPVAAVAASAPGVVTFPVPASAGVTFSDSAGNGGVYALAPLADGSVVAAGLGQASASGGGTSKNSPAVARLLPDGRLDPAFGSSGVALPGPPALCDAFPVQVLVDPSRRVLILGDYGNGRWSLCRLLASGSVDASFCGCSGQQGAVDLSGELSLKGAPSVSLLANGSILIGGQSSVDGRMLVARLTAGGLLDPSFGSGGVVTVSGPSSQTTGSLLATLPDGRFFDAIGASLLRLTAAGAPDPAFAGGAPVALAQPPAALLAQADGSVLVLGGSRVTKYTAAGALDASYGSGGSVATPNTADTLPNTRAFAAMLAAPDGSTVVAGPAPGSAAAAVIERLDQHGTADPAFGGTTGRTVPLPFGGGTYGADALAGKLVNLNHTGVPVPPPFAVAIRPDGSLVIGTGVDVVGVPNDGAIDVSFVEHWGLVAFAPSAALDTGFGAPSTLRVRLSLPQRRVRRVFSRSGRCAALATTGCIEVRFRPSATGLANVRVKARGQLVAQGALGLFTTASDTEPIPLTAAGRRLLRRGGRVTLTALLRAKDLAGNTAASQARAKLS